MWLAYVVAYISTMITFICYILGIEQMIDVRKKAKDDPKFCLFLNQVV